MFETVAPEAFRTRSRRVLYETLPVSLVVHAFLIGGYLTHSMWTITFPTVSPKLLAPYSLVSIPDPPPPPTPPPPKPQHGTPAPPPPPPALAQIVAPTVIPDSIPVVQKSIPLPPPDAPVIAAPVAEGGVKGGDINGVLGGELGGRLHGVIGGVNFVDDGRVHIERGAPLPLTPIEQEYPSYPHKMAKKGIEDSVIVRYVIGKDGRVKDVTILDHANLPDFDEAAVTAIRKWRFHPMVRNGEKVEVVHELLVNFQLIHGG
jgi:protein TonB